MPKELDCPNCGHTNHEKYCANCGQKQNYNYASKNLFIEAFQDYIGLDGKILRTLKTLVLKPGKLTADHIQGKRVQYIKPFQLFLFVNVLFLFLAVSRGSYDFTLYEFQNWSPPNTEMVNEWLREAIETQKITYQDYALKFNTNSDKIRKWLIFLLVPIFALLSYLFQFKKLPYFSQHLIFSIHFFTFYWLFITFVAPIITGVITIFLTYTDGITVYIYPAVNALYLFFAFRRINEENKYWSIAKSFIFAIALHYILVSYRVLLFFSSYYLSS